MEILIEFTLTFKQLQANKLIKTKHKTHIKQHCLLLLNLRLL